MRDREEWIREKEISPEGKNAEKEWKRKKIIFRLGVIVVILSVLAFCFLPTCIYRYGMYQMEQGKYSEAADTLNGLMAIPNLIALALLSPVVIKLCKEYFSSHSKK